PACHTFGDVVPERTQALGTPLRRVSGYDGPVDGADRDARDPVGLVAVLGQGCVDARLVGPQGSAALQDQRHLGAVRRQRLAPGLGARCRRGCRPGYCPGCCAPRLAPTGWTRRLFRHVTNLDGSLSLTRW